MAVVRFGPIVQSASGALGSVVFSRQGGTGIVRQRPMKVNQVSKWQVDVRARYATLFGFWRELSDDLRLTWFRCAQSYAAGGAGGAGGKLTGWQMFFMVNSRRLVIGMPIADAPFLSTESPEMSSIRLDVWPGGPVNLVYGKVFGSAYKAVQLFVQRTFRTWNTFPGRNVRSVNRTIFWGSSQNVTAKFIESQGVPGPLEYVRWRAISHGSQWPNAVEYSGLSLVPNVSAELVTNGDMELPGVPAVPTGWTLYNAGALASVFSDGWGDNSALKWTRGVGASTGVKSAANIDVSVAGTYVLRFAQRRVLTVTGVYGIFFEPTGKPEINLLATVPPADGLWHEYEYSMVIPAGYTAGYVFWYQSAGSALEDYLDNVSIRRNL